MATVNRTSLILVALLAFSFAVNGAAEEKKSKDVPTPANDHERLAADMIKFTDDVTAVLETVKDEASAKASDPKFDAFHKRVLKLKERTTKLGKADDAVLEAMLKKYGPTLQASNEAMVKQHKRIEDDAQLAALMKSNLDKLKVFESEPSTESDKPAK